MVDWTILTLGIVGFGLAGFHFLSALFIRDPRINKVLKISGMAALGVGIILVALAFWA